MLPFRSGLLMLWLCLRLTAQAETFASWAAGHGLTGADAGLYADPDHDRMVNLMEYMLADGDPTVPGPLSILPQQGWSQMREDGELEEWTAVHHNGPRDRHYMALKYKLRPGTEEYKAVPEISWSPMSSLAGGDGGLMRYYSGRAAVRIDAISGGYVQATSLFCDKLWQRGFFRLKFIAGVPAAVGEQLPTGLTFEPLAYTQRVVGSQTTSNVTDRDLKYTDVTSPTIVQDVTWPWSLASSGYSSGDVTRSSSATGVLSPHSGNTQLWDYVGSGTAILSVITPGFTYTRTVTVGAFSSVLSRTQTFPSTTGSLRVHLETQTDGRMGAYTSIQERHLVYSDYDPGTAYSRNANCWLTGVDLTPVAAWNSRSGNGRQGGTLVSPRHFIAAAHYGFAPGDTLHWVKADNTVVSRTVSAVATISGTDIQVGVLDSDVAAGIAFARILPDAWAAKLPTLETKGVPAISVLHGTLAHARDLTGHNSWVNCARPTVPANRAAFYADAVSGDSGSPCCLVVNNALVLVCCWYGSGGGSGPSVQANRAAINAAMSSLGGGYTLTDADLSAFTTY